MIEIPLSNGFNAQIDEEDFVKINMYKWYASLFGNVWYAYSTYTPSKGKSKTIQLHRLIMNFPKYAIDHIDGNGLNNQKKNLRPANKQQNGRNAGLNKNNKSGVKGVAWSKACNKWRAYITIDNKQKYLGVYDSIEEAAKIRKKAAEEIFGIFANKCEGEIK